MIAWWKRRRICAELRSNVEPWWSRWAVTLAVLAIVVFAILDKQSYAIMASCVFFLFCTVHFLLILLRKIHYRLIELFTAALLGGTINGLVLSMPGILTSPWFALTLVLAVSAWVLYGVVKGLACAQVFDVESSRSRVALIAAAWFTSAGPAMLGISILLYLPGDKSVHITPEIRAWYIPTGALGIVALVLKLVLEWKLQKAASRVISSND